MTCQLAISKWQDRGSQKSWQAVRTAANLETLFLVASNMACQATKWQARAAVQGTVLQCCSKISSSMPSCSWVGVPESLERGPAVASAYSARPERV